MLVWSFLCLTIRTSPSCCSWRLGWQFRIRWWVGTFGRVAKFDRACHILRGKETACSLWNLRYFLGATSVNWWSDCIIILHVQYCLAVCLVTLNYANRFHFFGKKNMLIHPQMLPSQQLEVRVKCLDHLHVQTFEARTWASFHSKVVQ